MNSYQQNGAEKLEKERFHFPKFDKLAKSIATSEMLTNLANQFHTSEAVLVAVAPPPKGCVPSVGVIGRARSPRRSAACGRW